MEPKSELKAGERPRGQLELVRDADGFRHYLDGRRLEKGDEIEMLLANGEWLRGRYDWTGNPVVWPAFRVELTGRVAVHAERKLTGAMPIPPAALLRWPTDGRH